MLPAPALAGTNGRYIEMDYQDIQFYGDLMLMMKKQWGDFSVGGALGTSLNDKTTNSTRYDSRNCFIILCQCFQSGKYHNEWFGCTLDRMMPVASYNPCLPLSRWDTKKALILI